jgi:cyanophycinase
VTAWIPGSAPQRVAIPRDTNPVRSRVPSMNVFLIGGGWSDELAPEIYGGFIEAAAAGSASGRPRIMLVLMGTDEESLAYHERYLHKLHLVGGHDLEVVRVPEGSPVDPAVVARLDDVDGLFVGGGPTPEYHESLQPAYGRIRARVVEGMAYAGFSAGAVIAASHAVIGGWRIDGIPVCPEDSNEDLDPVTVVDGIGLVDGAVDVHAAQWGNVSRLVAVVEAGLAPHGIAVDEDTVLGPDAHVCGTGRVWRAVGAASGGVTLTAQDRAARPR